VATQLVSLSVGKIQIKLQNTFTIMEKVVHFEILILQKIEELIIHL
jgi:hypothetical protein